MATYWDRTRVIDLGTFTINGANTIAYAPGQVVDIVEIRLVYTTANTTAGNVLTLQRRPVAGAAANQVSLGTVTTTAAISAGAVEVFHTSKPADTDGETAEDGSLRFTSAPYLQDSPPADAATDNYRIYPGQDFAIVSGGEGTAGVCNVHLVVAGNHFAPEWNPAANPVTELARTS